MAGVTSRVCFLCTRQGRYYAKDYCDKHCYQHEHCDNVYQRCDDGYCDEHGKHCILRPLH